MRQLLGKAALVLVSVFLSVAVCETVFRAIADGCVNEYRHRWLFVEHDPILGWRKIPNKKGRHVACEYETVERINSKGLRGPEYSYEKKPGEYRILALGDSFAEGYTVQFDELFSEVLERKLNDTKKNGFYEVVNAGTGGYSTDQELLFFQHEGKKYNPDLTVLMFYENDIEYNNKTTYSTRGAKPVFRLANGELQLENVPVPRPEEATEAGDDEPESIPQMSLLAKAKAWLGQNSEFYEWASERVKDTYVAYLAAIQLGLADKPAAAEVIRPIPDGFRVYQRRYPDDISEAWMITEKLLKKLREEAAAAGSEFVVFHIPFAASVYDDGWQSLKRKYGISDDEWNVDQVGIELAEICWRNRFDCIDPIEAFRDRARAMELEGERLYFAIDGHWNAHGHRLAGEILAEYVQNYPIR